MRRVLLSVLLGLAPACGGGGAEAVEGTDERPHVVLIVADDLGWGDVGFTGGDIETPRLDALARESLWLARFYAAPMCTPARAQLLTGRHAPDLGLVRNVKPTDDAGLPEGVETLPARLRGAGYATALVGKWHLGHARPAQRPRARGFDHTYGHWRGWIDYFTHEVEGVHDWHRDGVERREPGYSTDLIADEAVRTIAEHDDASPLFLLVAFNAPHTPLQPAPGDAPTPTGDERADARAVYTGMVEHLDGAIGRVVDAIDARGWGERTLVWFLSDNGANPRHGGDNGDLRGGKYTCFEGGLRVPAWVRWPGRVRTGTTHHAFATVDVAPTLEALAGLPPREELDGLDLEPWLLRDTFAFTRPDLRFAVDHARVERRALVHLPYKLIVERREDGEQVLLFDVLQDPLEQLDRAEAEPEVVRTLRARLEG